MKNSQKFWATEWNTYFDTYVGVRARQAYYLNAIANLADKSILEIAAGSFRDTMQLNKWGLRCTGIDYSSVAVQMARQYYKNDTNILEMDAFQMKFASKTFDISYHNGFFIYFDDDNILEQLIREQIRVTKTMVVCTVHNKTNPNLVSTFQKKGKENDLYNIRWFNSNEIQNLLSSYCVHTECYPFGIPLLDRYLARIGNKDIFRLLYRFYYKHVDISKCERIMIVGYI